MAGRFFEGSQEKSIRIMSEEKEKNAPKKEQKNQAREARKLEELQNHVEELQKELELNRKASEESEAKIQQGKDDYLRLMAEFETFRRRSAEDRLNLVTTASADTIKGLLPVLDDCERAIKMLEGSSDEAAREGTALIYDKLMAYLKTRGLEVIDAVGQKFDTDFHEAVTQFPAPEEDLKGKVIEVVQTGYTLNGKVLRYAKVVVGA